MDREHEEHLEGLKYDFTRLVDAKYRAGQKEHGGRLWRKKGLIDMAIDEAVDQVVYLLTLKEQLENKGLHSPNA